MGGAGGELGTYTHMDNPCKFKGEKEGAGGWRRARGESCVFHNKGALDTLGSREKKSEEGEKFLLLERDGEGREGGGEAGNSARG